MKKLFMFFLLIFMNALFLAAHPVNAQEEWKGFYAGGNGFVSSDQSAASAALQINQISNLFVSGRGIVVVPGTTRDFTASKRKTNGNGGVQTGYQWQAGKFVFGGEADLNPFHRTFSVSQSFQIPNTILAPASTVTAQRDAQLSSELSLRGRAGVAFGKTLVYGTVGYDNARVQLKYTDSYTNPGGITPAGCGTAPNVCFNSGPEGPVITTASQSKNMGGWTAGAGVEQKFGKRLSIGFEYRYTDLGSKTFTPANAATANTGPETVGTNGATGLLGSVVSGPTRISLKSDSFGVRVNFHF